MKPFDTLEPEHQVKLLLALEHSTRVSTRLFGSKTPKTVTKTQAEWDSYLPSIQEQQQLLSAYRETLIQPEPTRPYKPCDIRSSPRGPRSE